MLSALAAEVQPERDPRTADADNGEPLGDVALVVRGVPEGGLSIQIGLHL